MFKTSIATRVLSFAVLIALLLASFPTAATAAPTNESGLEGKWAKLVNIYNRQSIIHNNAPNWVNQWLADNPKAPKSKKAELQASLVKSNAAWAPLPFIVARHNGFDAEGNVVDKAAAQQSVKDLSKALQRYTAAMKNLRALLRQLKMEA